eukprot:TRINITY_DN62084_c0_g1_i1.p1 TRINITY_DN62084_c0_g1~~TRINITY_DN62084_c0_g1_i1.p1  ORF type:complete len:205 (-),score=38.44 TRINITY_DN62084_c0_g1_i1:19-633(-)
MEKEAKSRAFMGAGLALLPALLPVLFLRMHADLGKSTESDAVADFTLEELKGYREDGHLLLSVLGRVFDVTYGQEFYGQGQGYKVFAGHDCTRAFALTSTKAKWLNQGLEGLTEKQIMHLNSTYWETYVRKYPVVGRLVDAPYDPADYDKFAGAFSEVRRTRPTEAAAAESQDKKRESKCPMKRVARAVGDAIVNMLPRQFLPG